MIRIPLGATLMLLVLSLIFTAAGRPALAAGASIVIDAGSGRTLHAADADARRYPASLTKMMTLYLLFDALDAGKVKPGTQLRVSRRAAAQPPTNIGLRAGGTITVKDAILALATKSANDVAVVVAEALAGSESKFAQRMTTKARALGMKQTTFRNASGLHHPGQVTTARDMAMLGRALLRNHPRQSRVFATRSFRYGGTRYANHNRLLGVYRGLDGIKTGYTNAAGFNLVATARREQTRLIGVVMGQRSAVARNARMSALLDAGFRDMAKAKARVAASKPKATARVATSKPKAKARVATSRPKAKARVAASRPKAKAAVAASRPKAADTPG